MHPLPTNIWHLWYTMYRIPKLRRGSSNKVKERELHQFYLQAYAMLSQHQNTE